MVGQLRYPALRADLEAASEVVAHIPCNYLVLPRLAARWALLVVLGQEALLLSMEPDGSRVTRGYLSGPDSESAIW